MKNLYLFLLFAFFFIPKNSFACTCIGTDSFCESLLDNKGNVVPDVILRGKTAKISPKGKDVEILQIIYGDYNKSTFTALAGMCTQGFEKLEDDKEYIFALNLFEDRLYPLHCAIFFLEIENEIVTGEVADGVNSIALDKLDELENCGFLFEFLSFEDNFSIFPNPTFGDLRINKVTSNESIQNVEVKIFDFTGREVLANRKSVGVLPEEVWTLDIQYLPAGIYLIRLSDKHNDGWFKIVKQ